MEEYFKNRNNVLADDEPVAQFQLAVFDGNGEHEDSVIRHRGDPHLIARNVLRLASKDGFRVAFTAALSQEFINNLNDN
jgi:hypothetical protein